MYPLQFRFRHYYSPKHAIINLTEDIRKKLDEGKVGCGIFVDLQKTFDTVDGVANDWFKYCLSDRRQFGSINGFNSNNAMLKYGVSRGSVLGPVLFLIYINDLNYTAVKCTILQIIQTSYI